MASSEITMADDKQRVVSTFSIVGYDPATGELGVAVASRFFAVGTVVPWARAGIGAVATQSFANTSFGWRGLDLLSQGATPDQVVDILLQNDEKADQRQFGIVNGEGRATTYTGKDCLPWAGGRSGSNYAIQGNILTGEAVVIAMEETFLKTPGSLAERLFAALLAGHAQGGDARGKQSAALIIVKEKAGYGGFTDRAIDIRVDDHAEPFKELERLLTLGRINYAWNEGWTLFTQDKFDKALPPMEETAKLAPFNPEVLYDLAVIRLAGGDMEGSLQALDKALSLNPKLKSQAAGDGDLDRLRTDKRFQKLIGK
ncbi:MAG: DUF1028 domain-containing protein [Calditrichales bacterium]|nr:MAG: DUF1028 domain-containing protein [Calditrichales bacterium]